MSRPDRFTWKSSDVIVVDLTTKAGPIDEPRDEAGRWTDGGGDYSTFGGQDLASIKFPTGPPGGGKWPSSVYFHGVDESLLRQIKAGGLQPSLPVSSGARGESPRDQFGVYIEHNYTRALGWAAAGRAHSVYSLAPGLIAERYAVVALKPDKALLTHDPHFGVGRSSYVHAGEISPDRIVGVDIWEKRINSFAGTKEWVLTARQGYRSSVAKAITEAENALTKFSEDQPRDERGLWINVDGGHVHLDTMRPSHQHAASAKQPHLNVGHSHGPDRNPLPKSVPWYKGGPARATGREPIHIGLPPWRPIQTVHYSRSDTLAKAVRAAIALAESFFKAGPEDEARDDQGRWTDGGGPPEGTSQQPSLGADAQSAVRAWADGEDLNSWITHPITPGTPGEINLRRNHDQALALQQAVQNSATGKVLYRGVAMPTKLLSSLDAGKTFDVLLGSATTSRSVADSFASHSQNLKEGAMPVRLRIIGEKRGLDITSYTDIYGTEKESVISGRFQVVSGKTVQIDGSAYNPDVVQMRGIEVTVRQIADIKVPK